MAKFKKGFSHFIMFVKIAELGSLSKAARELGLTPSAVSRGLSLLEAELETNLVNRTTRALTLTDSGKALLDRAQSIINEFDNIFESIKKTQKPSGEVNITSSLALGCSQLPHIISSFQELYPEVTINLHLDDDMINLHEANYDIALRITNSNISPNYISEKIADIHWLYYASSEYINKHSPITSPQDVDKHKCLVYPKMLISEQWTFKHKSSDEIHNINIRPHISCNSSLFLLQCVLMNEGIACLPNYLVNAYHNNGKLQQILKEYESGKTHNLYAITIKRKIDNPTINEFIRFLKEQMAK